MTDTYEAIRAACTCTEGLCRRCSADLRRAERQATDKFERAIPAPMETR